MANFGGNINQRLDNKPLNANRTLVVTCLLAGSVAWIALRSLMTAILTTEQKAYPFDSLAGLLGSDFS